MRARINVTLRRCQFERRIVADVKPVGGQIDEMRLHFGPGDRVYYLRRGETVVLLLVGGDTSTQAADIARAKSLAVQIREEQQWS